MGLVQTQRLKLISAWRKIVFMCKNVVRNRSCHSLDVLTMGMMDTCDTGGLAEIANASVQLSAPRVQMRLGPCSAGLRA
jgi:hypothetical protein